MNNKELSYHLSQLQKPYRSTEVFYEWLQSLNMLHAGQKIMDVGAGAGANTMFFAKKTKADFMGIDCDADLIKIGKEMANEMSINNISFECKNLYELNKESCDGIDGIISTQFLSWQPNYKIPLRAMTRLAPRWIAATSLFYEGKINAFIKINNYYRRSSSKKYSQNYYNVYSLDFVKEFFAKMGYASFSYKKFDIDIDLEKKDKDLGTFTKQLSDGSRLQFSGPLFMPWYFICASKN